MAKKINDNSNSRRTFDEILYGKKRSFEDLLSTADNYQFNENTTPRKSQILVDDYPMELSNIKVNPVQNTQDIQGAINLVKSKTAKQQTEEDLYNLPSGAYEYIEANKKENKVYDAIYKLTKNNKGSKTTNNPVNLEVINNIAAAKKSNVSETLQSKYGMDKATADYYENNWNNISANKKEIERQNEQDQAIADMDEKEYNLLKTYAKSMSTLKFNTNVSIQQSILKERKEAKEQLMTVYGLSDDEISKLADYVSRDADRKFNVEQKSENEELSKTGLGRAALRTESLAVAPVAGVTAAIGSTVNKLAGNPLNIYDDNYMLSNLKDNAQTAVSEAVGEKYGQKVQFLNDALMSVAESAETMIVGSNVASFLGLAGTSAEIAAKIASYPLFSAGAFASTLKNKVESGQNEDQAFAYAVATGIAEGLFEELSFDKLQKLAKSTGKVGTVEFFKNLLKQGLYEGTEEINTDIANTITDALINADYSDYNLKIKFYEDQGNNPDKARLLATKDLGIQILEDGLAGAISGILMGGGASVVKHHNYKTIGSSASAETLKKATDLAMNSENASKSTAREIANKMTEENRDVESLTSKEKTQLFESLASLQDDEIDQSVNKALESRIENPDTLEKAKALFNEYINTDMTDQQFEEKLVNKVAKNSQERNAILEARNEALTVNAESNPITNTLNAAQIDKQIDIQNKAIQKEIEKQDKLANKQYAKFEKAVSSKEKYAAAKGVAAVTVNEGKEKTASKVLKLANIKGSQNTKVVLEGGKTALLKDITFNDQNLGKLYNGLSTSIGNVNVANKALENYKGQEVESYIDAFRVVYNLGRESVRTNKDASWLLDNKLDSYIVYDMGGSQIAAEIFYLGKNDATEYKNTKEAVYGKPENISFRNRSNADDLIKTESDLKNFLALLSDRTEAKIEMSSYLKDNNGNYVQAVVAAFAENIIYFTDSEDNNALQSVLHESMEKMRKANIEGYNLIVSEVLQYVQETKGSKYLIDVIQKYQKAYTQVEGYTPVEEVSEEYTNDFVAGILTSEEGLKDLAKWSTTNNSEKAKTLFENIKELFDLILNELRSYMNKNKHTMQQGARDGFEATGKRIEALRDTVISELNKMGQQNGQTANEGNEKKSFSVNVDEQQKLINESMTMDQAKDMIQRAFKLAKISGYKNGDEWLNEEGIEEVTLVIENEYTIQELYLNKIPAYLDGDIYVEDILEAYINKTLTGKVKPKKNILVKNELVRQDIKVADDKFYSPQEIEDAKELLEIASQRLTKENKTEVTNARAKIILFAHDKNAAYTLGISESDLNKKLRSWSNYSATAKNISMRINQDAALQNRWTGIENSSYISKQNVTVAEVERMVKSIDGIATQRERNYIARTMLAFDTHIDWSNLSFDFKTYQEVNNNDPKGRTNGFYTQSTDKITAKVDAPHTIAHEMTHALDSKWGRDFGTGMFLTNLVTNGTWQNKYEGEALLFLEEFADFVETLRDTSDIRSSYTGDIRETFARFGSKFVSWTNNIATGVNDFEVSFYNDKFTQAQYVHFARILQMKAALDNNGILTETKKFSVNVDSEGNNLSEQQIEYFKDSKARDDNGKLRVFYHGTNSEEFNIFDMSYLGAGSGDIGFFGKGFYFAFNKREAKWYGKNVIEAYLNTKKPYYFSDELGTYKGKSSMNEGNRAIFVTNFANKFPELSKDFQVDAWNTNGEYTPISFENFAKEFESIYNTKKFKITKEFDDYSNEYIYVVTADTKEESVTLEDGTVYKWNVDSYRTEFSNKKDAADQAFNTYKYLNDVVYDGIKIPNFKQIITQCDFSNAVKAMGYDSIFQDKDGDEVLVFDSSQIKRTDNTAPTNNPDIRYSVKVDSDKQIINKLTGQEISTEAYDILDRLNRNIDVSMAEINDLPEIKYAREKLIEIIKDFKDKYPEFKNIPNADIHSLLLNTEERLKLREKIIDSRVNSGSLSGFDENGKEVYNGSVNKGYQLDIVLGLPASGKSSSIVNPLSEFYKSQVIDSDIVKEQLPEFNNGWGAGLVHEESSDLNMSILEECLKRGNNIVLPIVGSKYNKVLRYIEIAKELNYSVRIHYNELPKNKSLARLINRFFKDGRFLDPELIFKAGDNIENVYEEIKKGGYVDEYSRWNNDVERGKRPIITDKSRGIGVYTQYSRSYGQNGRQNAGRNVSTNKEGEKGKDLERKNEIDTARYSVKIPDYDFSDTVAFFGTDEEYEAAEKRENEISEWFKNIIEQPDFKALRYKVNYGQNQYHLLHHSTRPGVDYQLSVYDDKGGIMHSNYYKTNMDKLYRDLTTEVLFLKDRNLEILPEDIETRKFSVKVDDDLALFESIIAENEEFKEASNVITNTVKNIDNLKIKEADIKKIASGIKAEYKTNASIQDITDTLTKVFNYMNQDNVDYDSLVQIMSEVAKPMLENVTDTSTTRSESWDKFSSYLRNTKIKLSYGQIREVTSIYGSTENYRKKLFGVTTISREATMTLDEMWSELVDASGNLLPAYVADTDQPSVLLETIDSLRPQNIVSETYKMNLEQASFDLALEIYRRFFEAQAEINKSAELREAIGKLRTDQVVARRKAIEEYKRKLEEQKKLLEAEKQKNIKALAKELKDSEEMLIKAVEEHDQVSAALIESMKKKNERKIAQLKLQNNRKLAEVKSKNFDQRKAERDRRRSTILKEELRSQVNSINKMLKSPNISNYIKTTLVRQTIDVLESIDLDTGRSKNMSIKLMQLHDLYERYKGDETFSFDYDEATSKIIDNLRQTFENRNYTELSNKELTDVIDMVKRVKRQIQNAGKLLNEEKFKDARDAAQKAVTEIRQSRGTTNKYTEMLDDYMGYQLNAYRWFRKASGYDDNGALMQMYNSLDEGQMKMINMQKEVNSMFANVLEGEENQKNVRKIQSVEEKDLVNINLNKKGTPVMATREMMLSVLLHCQNADNTRHIVLNGFRVPDLELYKKGKLEKAYEKGELKKFFTYEDISSIRDSLKQNNKDATFDDAVNWLIKWMQARAEKYRKENLSEWEEQYLQTAENLFHNYLGAKVNEVSQQTRGYALAKVVNYFPIHTDSDFTRTEFAALKNDGTLEGMGFLKERVKASNPIYLESLSNVIIKQTNDTSRYYGFSIPVRNINMIMDIRLRNGDQIDSVRYAVTKVWGKTYLKIFQNILRDIQTGRGSEEGLAQTLTTMRGNFAAATLTANIGVGIKQAASFPTAAAVLGKEPLIKAFKDIPKGITAKGIPELEEINPLLWYRSKGQSSTDINYATQSDVYKWLDKNHPKLKALSVDLIQNIDSATVRTLEYASMYYVDMNFKELEKGSDKYWAKVSEVFTKVVEETQPNYTVLQRPEILKEPNALVRQLFMFKTQPMQNLGILYDALGEYLNVKKHYKKDDKVYKDAAEKLGRAIWSQLIAAATFSAQTILSNLVYHKLYKYDQDDDKSMIEEMALAFVTGITSTLSGILLGGDWLYSAIMEWIFDQKNYGIEVSVVEMINDVFSTVTNMIKYTGKLADAKTEAERETAVKNIAKNTDSAAVLVGEFFGIPVNNVINSIGAILLPIKDLYTGAAWGESKFIWDESSDSQYLRMYDALLSNDSERYNKLYKEQVSASEAQDPQKSINNKIKSMIKKAYEQKEINADQALEYLNNAGIEADDTLIDEWDYKLETGATSYSQYSRLNDAIMNSYDNKADRAAIKEEINKLVKNGVDKSKIAANITKNFKPIYLENKSADLKNLLLSCYMSCGISRDDALKKINSWK